MDRRWIRRQCIGKGSFGAVNLAVETSTGRFFAVKSVNLNSSPPQAAVALENEIRVLRSLDSPNIISYLGDDFTEEPFSDEACRNLHLEYLAGGTLANAAASGKICERKVRAYTRSIVRGLQYLHSTAGFVHGDVKGRNILLGSSIGVAKLSDFGSARKISGAVEEELFRGTPLWMAPEVARGEAPTPASDVWSLGCTVIEMSGGALSPWGNTWAGAAAEMHRIGFTDVSPEFPSSLSEIGHDFLSNCLSRDPSKRCSCDELLQHPFLSDSPAITGPSREASLIGTK
ncbi:Mitogen-activated protein kinase kinase kinase 2 [Platanthera guangdongensis]|uniref:Mitogen-activated protein kinase kinase kinase 2 n=1 Tax=Platanthera guangdongensis TaxID=2320717 RepID=A0ABR2N405_9ASPA